MQDLQRSESSQSTPNLLEGEFNEDIEIWDRRTKSIYISIPTHAWHITHQLIKNLIALLSQLWCLHRIPSITRRLLVTEIGLRIKGTHFYGYLHDYCCQIGWFWFTSLLIQQQKYMERANWRAYVAYNKIGIYLVPCAHWTGIFINVWFSWESCELLHMDSSLSWLGRGGEGVWSPIFGKNNLRC